MTTLKLLTQSTILGTGTESETALLASAVLAGIGELGGMTAGIVDSVEYACPPEIQPGLPEKAAILLKRILASEFEDTLPEFLQLTIDRGYIAPPETLPSLLGLGKNSLRSLVIPVVGERGRWLAAYNPAWSYALGRDPKEAWEHGTRAERVVVLEQVRASAPEKARDWVQSDWEQDSPEDRAAFISMFAIGLSMDDESFLESCLDDKRKEVRDAARALLMRLEVSRFVQRMWARVKPLIRLKSKFLGGETLEVTLPGEPDPAAKRDGIGGTLLRKKMGQKANLLAQMLSLVPPALWSREFGKSPEKLIAAALNCEWKEPVLLGWQLAAQLAEDVAWAESIATSWATQAETRNVLNVDTIGDGIMLMRSEKVEALVTSSIKPMINELNDKSLLIPMLEKYKRPWTVKMARVVVQSAQRQSGDFRHTLPLALPGFAHWIPPELADEFSTGWVTEPKGSWREKINMCLLTLNFRNEIRQSLKETL